MGDVDDDGILDWGIDTLLMSGAGSLSDQLDSGRRAPTVCLPSECGAELVATGDVTGDGIDDIGLLVRRRFSDTLLVRAGGAMSIDALWEREPVAEWSRTSGFDGGPPRFSNPVDIDGDGVDDLIVGNERALDSLGQVEVFLGPLGPRLSAETAQVLWSAEGPMELGGSLLAGDWDRDGRSDLAIGAAQRPAVLFLDGSSLRSGAVEDLGRWLPASSLGEDALHAGDFDGDGEDELVMAAPWDDEVFVTPAADLADLESVDRAAVRIYGLSCQRRADGMCLPSLTGWSVATGDFNGDGYDDLAIVSLLESGRDGDRGGLSLVFGPLESTWLPDHPLRWLGHDISAVDSVGDIDGDGMDDLFVYSRGTGGPGRAVWVAGREDWLP